MCISAARRGGWVTVLAVYGVPYDNFPVGQIFDQGIFMAFGQPPVHKHIDTLIGSRAKALKLLRRTRSWSASTARSYQTIPSSRSGL